MREVLESLRSTLERQLKTQETLLDLSMKTRGAVIAGNSEELSRIVQTMLREVTRMSSAEKSRNALMPSVAQLLGVAKDAPISAILAASEADERAALEPLAIKLQSATSHLAEMNEANKKLIESQMEYSEAMINLYVTPEDQLNVGYGEDGQEVDSSVGTLGFFDIQA